ncbi:MAG: TonB-dependent receptor [Acidobacteriota bacterium]
MNDGGAIIPGATVTATNDNTGVVSTQFTNNSGAYSFPRLPFGSYTVKAELDGFQAKTFTDVALRVGQQARLNFELEVSAVTTEIEVSSSAEDLILETSSGVGDILLEDTVMDLPQIGRDALDLIKVMSGVVVTDDEIFGANDTSFAGVQATGVNVQRDGVTVNDVRFPTGINAATRVNPDMVGEFKMVLAPVDAEAGRGNAQVQIATKSGSNQYHGNAVWNVQNTALDPNTWDNNRTETVAPWRNVQEISASVSGPIIQNKTFFFVLFDYQLAKTRLAYNAMSLTPCARRGIFRFYDRWNNGNVEYPVTSAAQGGSNPTIATVDVAGNPVMPQWEPNAWEETPYTGQLRYASVFGTLNNPDELLADCSNADVTTGTWDPVRPEMDPSGFIADFLDKLPMPNNYEIGDGLNLAGFKWTRGQDGAQNLYGVGEDTYRKQINIKIDHNFNEKHRVSGSWSFERDHADDTMKTWPENSWSGGGKNQPQVMSLNFQSSFRPTLLNEFKFGMSRTGSNILAPQNRPENGDALQNYLAEFGTLVNGEVGVIEPGRNSTRSFATDAGFLYGGSAGNASTPYGTRGLWAIGDMRDSSPRYTVGDTLTWVKGTHSIRVGGEWRRSSSENRIQFIIGNGFGTAFPQYRGGELPSTPLTFDNITGDLAGSSAESGNKRVMRDLLIFLSGSLSEIGQARFINSIDATEWNDPREEPYMVRDTIMKEFSLFAKDDWKVRPDLTLNLGIRWDYYGVPYIGSGLTVGLEGGGNAIFGPTASYDNWFQPIGPGDVPIGDPIALRSIGPDGLNPDESLYENRRLSDQLPVL